MIPEEFHEYNVPDAHQELFNLLQTLPSEENCKCIAPVIDQIINTGSWIYNRGFADFCTYLAEDLSTDVGYLLEHIQWDPVQIVKVRNASNTLCFN